MIQLADIEAAAMRIDQLVRKTPTMVLDTMSLDGDLSVNLVLKLECLQVTGSFKPRGAFNKVLTSAARPMGLTTSSGGNHGIAVAYVGKTLGIPVEIPLPATVAPEKLELMRSLGARAEIVGPTFHVSNARAKEIADERGYMYIHPFADPDVIAGQGTCGLELSKSSPPLYAVVVAVGGGGFLGGIALALKCRQPSVRIIGVEPCGANALTRSLEAGRPIVLDKVETRAGTLAPPMTELINLELAQRYVDTMINLTDEEMLKGARWLWRNVSIAAELGGAAALAAVLAGNVKVSEDQNICCVVCGSGTAGLT
jgi:threonine dehydratase